MNAAEPFVILNPTAGRGSAAKRQGDLVHALKRVFPRFEIVETRESGDGERLARKALRSGASFIVAAGGDGTLHEVVNGFFDGGRAVAPEATLGILPAGTGSDFARLLSKGTAADLDTWVARLKRGKILRTDVGHVSWKSGRRYFINITDVGLGGEAALRVKQGLSYVPKRLVYLASGLLSLASFRPAEVAVLLASGEVIRETALMVVVANGQYFGVGMHIAPRAKIDDGLFDLYIIRDRSIIGTLAGISKMYRGAIGNMPGVIYRQVKGLEITSETPLSLDIDGEPLGTLPAQFDIVPAAIKLIVP